MFIIIIVIIAFVALASHVTKLRTAKAKLTRCHKCPDQVGSYKRCVAKGCDYFSPANSFPDVIPCQVCDDFNNPKICNNCPHNIYLNILNNSRTAIQWKSYVWACALLVRNITKKFLSATSDENIQTSEDYMETYNTNTNTPTSSNAICDTCDDQDNLDICNRCEHFANYNPCETCDDRNNSKYCNICENNIHLAKLQQTPEPQTELAQATDSHQPDTHQPTEPVQATNTNQPTEPVQATHTNQPTEPVQATHTNQPTALDQAKNLLHESTDVNQPTEPVQPTETHQPTALEQAKNLLHESTDVNQPTEPVQATNPYYSTILDKPTEPEQATSPYKSTDLYKSTESDHTTDPYKSTESDPYKSTSSYKSKNLYESTKLDHHDDDEQKDDDITKSSRSYPPKY